MINETYSIGIERDDGDFEILATLNNTGGHMSRAQFEALKEALIVRLYENLGTDEVILCLARTDAPDFVTLED